MIPSFLINKALVWIAKKLKVSPGVAHIMFMLLLTALVSIFEDTTGSMFSDRVFLTIWFGFCAFVVLVTWLTKGEYRKIWWKAKPWQDS